MSQPKTLHEEKRDSLLLMDLKTIVKANAFANSKLLIQILVSILFIALQRFIKM